MQIVHNRRIPGRERPLNLFEGLNDFALLFNWFLVSSIALLVFYIIVLVITSLISPAFVKTLDEKMTDNLVRHLVEHQDYETAISLMEITPEYVQKNSPCSSLLLGECYERTGAYSNALKYYLDNYQIIQSDEIKASADSTIYYAAEYLMARTICNVYIAMGDRIRAEEFLQIMEEKYSDSLLTIVPEFVDKVNIGHGADIGDLLWIPVSPEYDKAVLKYPDDHIKSIRMLKDLIIREVDESRLNANVKLKHLNTIIGWEIENGMDVAALEDIVTAISISKKAYDNRDFEQFGKLATYCKWAGDDVHYHELINAYRRYIYKNYKKDSPEAIHIVKYLVEIGHLYQAENMLVRICSNTREKIKENVSIMSDDQRDFYVRTLEEPFAYSEELLTAHPSPRMAKLVAENTLFKKGLLLRSNRNQRISILSKNDPYLTAKYDEYLSARKELNIIKNIDRPDQIIRRSILQKKIFNLDKELAESCSDYIGDNLFGEMSIETLKKTLGKKDMFIYLSSNRNGSLFALKISRKKDVQYISIGDINEIETRAFDTPEMLYSRTDLSNKLLSTLTFVKKGKGVNYCSTSGIYNKIALQSLRVSESDYLIDIADIRLISDPFMISKQKSEKKISGRVSLWGGIRYSENMDEPYSDVVLKHRTVKRGEHLVYLPGSLSEVEGIKQTLSINGISNELYAGWNATEESFKERDGRGDQILHVSTHGYFNGLYSSKDNPDAMDNSGLLFAGSEKYWIQKDTGNVNIMNNGNDGILKASEIELMNLNNCYLVVLSACETGLGIEDNSEGVYGLQRAFRLAGADNVLMSLWEIPDEETSFLMQTFYQALIQGYDINKALETAQKKVRERYPSPESWGGFVLLN